jgi:hypothetical protein
MDSFLMAETRSQLVALTSNSPYLTDAERLRANHNIHECEDLMRMVRWIVNVKRELTRRQQQGASYGRIKVGPIAGFGYVGRFSVSLLLCPTYRSAKADVNQLKARNAYWQAAVSDYAIGRKGAVMALCNN